ncbi:MAG: GTP-dependent dephospho-CoA kinase family protein [Candidatus Methanomethylophilaceae archaeon]|jgi:hypothetical protein
MSGGWRLPEDKRDVFKKPIGKELKEADLEKYHNKKVITVGDVVSLTVRRSGIVPLLSVYDGMTERCEMTDFAVLVKQQGWRENVVRNPAGTITCELVDAVKNAFAENMKIIRVEGEEDLALMPCILYAPNGTEVIYGWPGKGMMSVTTNDIVRKKTEELWKMMEDFE